MRKMRCLSFLLLTLSASAPALAHDQYMGNCPDFDPMSNFDWDEVNDVDSDSQHDFF